MDWRFARRQIGKKPRTLAKLLACFCLIFSYSRQNFIGGVLSSSRPLFGFIFTILASLLARGSASIQLICQSAWLGLLLLLLALVARVICKIHCSTISVVCCCFCFYVVFRLAVFFTSSWREDSANQVTDKLN